MVLVEKMEHRNMSSDQIQSTAAFAGGGIVAVFSSIRLWLAHINLLNIPLDSLIKVGVTVAISFFGGIVGMASKDVYRLMISPRLKKWMLKLNSKSKK